MAQVFTVYNCGTGFNRERTDELIGYLGSITSGMQAKPNSVTPQDKWMICDGPGSSSKGINPDAHTPGSGLLKKLRGNVTGHGWEQNVSACDDDHQIHSRGESNIGHQHGGLEPRRSHVSYVVSRACV